MYLAILNIHNTFRWVAAFFLFYALFKMYKGLFLKSSWSESERKASLFLTISLDIQLLLGFLLYFVYSPLTKEFLNSPVESMSSNDLRFFGIEHIFYMVVATILGHIGSSISKKTIDDRQKFKRISMFFSLVLILILIGMPWTRPLLPFI